MKRREFIQSVLGACAAAVVLPELPDVPKPLPARDIYSECWSIWADRSPMGNALITDISEPSINPLAPDDYVYMFKPGSAFRIEHYHMIGDGQGAWTRKDFEDFGNLGFCDECEATI